MNITWSLAGQIATVWLVVAAIAAPVIARWIRVRKARTHLRGIVPLVVLNRHELEKAVRSDIAESAWQTRAREAEGLDGDAA